MDMNLELRRIITLLEQYKLSSVAQEFLAQEPHEWKRRESYLNNLIRALWQCLKLPEEMTLLYDDLCEILEHGFYHNPRLPNHFAVILRIVSNVLKEEIIKRASAIQEIEYVNSACSALI